MHNSNSCDHDLESNLCITCILDTYEDMNKCDICDENPNILYMCIDCKNRTCSKCWDYSHKYTNHNAKLLVNNNPKINALKNINQANLNLKKTNEKLKELINNTNNALTSTSQYFNNIRALLDIEENKIKEKIKEESDDINNQIKNNQASLRSYIKDNFNIFLDIPSEENNKSKPDIQDINTSISINLLDYKIPDLIVKKPDIDRFVYSESGLFIAPKTGYINVLLVGPGSAGKLSDDNRSSLINIGRCGSVSIFKNYQVYKNQKYPIDIKNHEVGFNNTYVGGGYNNYREKINMIEKINNRFDVINHLSGIGFDYSNSQWKEYGLFVDNIEYGSGGAPGKYGSPGCIVIRYI